MRLLGGLAANIQDTRYRQISISRRSEFSNDPPRMNSSAADAPLDIEALRQARAATRIGHTIHYFSTIGSTSDHARELGVTGAGDGVVVIAESQTRGRGR